jgi:SAM-dependent methyltransferase
MDTESRDQAVNPAPPPAWLRDAAQRLRHGEPLGEELIGAICAMGRAPAEMSPGERQYVVVHGRRYARTAGLLPAGSSGRLLDVGCYPGHLAAIAGAHGWQVAGISLAGENWGDPQFESRLRSAGIEVVSADIQRDAFPFADESFDAAFFNETIEHLAFNPFQPLDEIWRVLRPGGHLVFSVPNLVRFDVRWAALRGRTIHAGLENALSSNFPSDIANRHVREYTFHEVRHFLEAQDKYLYRFQVEEVAMDRSLDGMFCGCDGEKRDWRRVTKATFLRDVLTRFLPGLRSGIILRARKPVEHVGLAAADIAAAGFLAAESTGTGDGFVRRPIHAAWMGARATLRLRLPPGRVRYVDLWVVLPAPGSLPPRRLAVRGGTAVQAADVMPSPEPRRFRVPLDAKSDGTTPLELALATDAWRPCDHGLPGDGRDLGVMICLDRAAAWVEPAEQ